MWEFPGGKVREKERADEAARRELLEEVGLDLPVESFEPFTFVHHDYGDRRVLLLVFLARAEGTRLVWERTNLTAEGEKRPSGVSPGSLETRWVSLSELAAFEMPEANRAIIRRLYYPAMASKIAPPSVGKT